jgi:signal transduction histidine kinase
MTLANQVSLVEESCADPEWTAQSTAPAGRRPGIGTPGIGRPGIGENIHQLPGDAGAGFTPRPPRPETWTDDFLRAAVEWLWETDAEMRVTYVSRGVARRLGIPPALLIGRRLIDLGAFHAAPRPQAAAAPLQARRPFRDHLFEMRGATGDSLFFRLSGVPTFDERQGSFTGFRGTGTSAEPPAPAQAMQADTQAAQALVGEIERLATLVSRLRYAEQQRAGASGADLAGEPAGDAGAESVAENQARLAHELRSPLNAIVGYAELVEQAKLGPLPEKYREYLHSIVTAARHLDSVIANFGGRPRCETPQVAEARSIDLVQVMDEVRRIATLEAEKAGIDCSRIRLAGSWQVRGDHAAVVQIFVNLAINAVKFSRPGGAVGVLATPKGKTHLAVTLWDEGIGIAEDNLPHIFNPGYRIRRDTTPGSGLGLSIAHDLVQAMNGRIEVESEPGEGTRFTVTLRRADIDPAATGAF